MRREQNVAVNGELAGDPRQTQRSGGFLKAQAHFRAGKRLIAARQQQAAAPFDVGDQDARRFHPFPKGLFLRRQVPQQLIQCIQLRADHLGHAVVQLRLLGSFAPPLFDLRRNAQHGVFFLQIVGGIVQLPAQPPELRYVLRPVEPPAGHGAGFQQRIAVRQQRFAVLRFSQILRLRTHAPGGDLPHVPFAVRQTGVQRGNGKDGRIIAVGDDDPRGNKALPQRNAADADEIVHFKDLLQKQLFGSGRTV